MITQMSWDVYVWCWVGLSWSMHNHASWLPKTVHLKNTTPSCWLKSSNSTSGYPSKKQSIRSHPQAWLRKINHCNHPPAINSWHLLTTSCYKTCCYGHHDVHSDIHHAPTHSFVQFLGNVNLVESSPKVGWLVANDNGRWLVVGWMVSGWMVKCLDD